MFNHHNPLINIEHYNYYIRCINRFKILVKKKQHKLFIMMFVNLDNINNIIKFNNKFSKYTSNYTLLIILHIQNQNYNDHMFVHNKNIHFLELHTLSVSNGLKFNNDDNIYLDNIIKSKYKLNT